MTIEDALKRKVEPGDREIIRNCHAGGKTLQIVPYR